MLMQAQVIQPVETCPKYKESSVPVLHGACGEVGDGDQVALGQRVVDPKVVVEEGQDLGGHVQCESALLLLAQGSCTRAPSNRVLGAVRLTVCIEASIFSR